MQNPKPTDELTKESASEINLATVNTYDLSDQEFEDILAVYKLDYNQPLGNSLLGIYMGMFASILDGNVGACVIFIGVISLIGMTSFPTLIVIIAVFIAVTGFCYLLVALLYRSTDIVIDSDGINFPSIFAVSLKFANERHWSEITAVRFANLGGNSLEDDRILIGFADDAYVKLEVDGFSQASLKKLILLLNTFRPDIQIKSDFVDLLQEANDRYDIKKELLVSVSDHTTKQQSQTEKALTFTKIWESELNSRYGTTAYTPLECGDFLSDDNYKVLGQIAFGGLSAIYLAQDKDGNLVVLKESVLPESAEEETKEKALEMFQREAKLLCGISHRNIAQVYDYFVFNDRHYMVLQHIDGRTVRDFVQEYGPQEELTALRWGIELASTLSYLHNLEPPVIHRDLTPDNIIIRKDGSISIIDFGAANNFLGTATCTVVGKSSYIPLEQFQGKAKLASDIYAFGATLYFILTACDPEPFSESNLEEKGFYISEALKEIVADCTKVDVKQRIKTTEELLERLAGATEPMD